MKSAGLPSFRRGDSVERIVAPRPDPPRPAAPPAKAPARLNREISEWDKTTYREITATELTDAQTRAIITPPQTYPQEEAVLAVHWHPEIVPIRLIRERIYLTFPAKQSELIIPTQHNVIMSYGDYAGVEVDCYSPEFKRKVQLLFHFRKERAEAAHTLRAMIAHTFKYRASQLLEFLDTLLEPRFEPRLQKAARDSSADAELIAFVRLHAHKLKRMLAEHEASTPPEMFKNKLLREYFDRLRDHFNDTLIDRAQVFLRDVKREVKANFNNAYFYETREFIEEARANGAGIIVPHPEQFWPILLADYDIDGYEVWNPQSYDYTEFLISAVGRLNQRRERLSRPILITMGDDCHMGEKLKPPELQDETKAGREVGYQPAWNDLMIRKALILSNITKEHVIADYKGRLS